MSSRSSTAGNRCAPVARQPVGFRSGLPDLAIPTVVPVLFALSVACLALAGCSERKSAQYEPSRATSVPDVALVARRHLSAPHVQTMLRLPTSGGSFGLRIAAPDLLSDIPQPLPAGGSELARVEQGLAERVESTLKSYSADVVEREQMTADVNAGVQREKLEPELESELQRIEAERNRRVFEVRSKASPELAKLRTEAALLQGRIRTTPGEMAGGLKDALQKLQSRIEDRQSSADAHVKVLYEEYDAKKRSAAQRWESRVDAIAARERALARERAREQIERKTAQSRETLDAMSSRLRSLGYSPNAGLASGSREVSFNGAGFDEAARAFRQSAGSIRRKMAADARLAARLVRQTDPPSAGSVHAADKASRLLGVR